MTVLIDGVPGEQVSALDRGLAYGDGVYRTLELVAGRPRLWRWQWQRLADDCVRLCLPLPDECLVLAELEQAAAGLERAVAKIVLTRGAGRRGYAMPADAVPTRIVSANAWAGYPTELAEQGVTVRLCELRLGLQPRLAGIKHLNRLENVLARSEWSDPAIHEGLLLDSEGYLVEGTMSNLFQLRGGELVTPLLDRSGVAGALRAWVFDNAPALGLVVREARLTLDDLDSAEAVFLCNSLIGLWPVVRLDGRTWQIPEILRALAARLAVAS
ncbi:aminodeoxychorismate lyase [Pseudogulbenkiania sp. MAI-1]|uniref:aminodeoxychorismate lyase n=1 Tax=Pseudogulbenkiania sp. MAI-1 TaxID=990370 RepID=UPI00045E7E36|nr:aminodeoxychorismate lyase [Pseudogulbenkiania sp. MAI-1]